MNVLALIPARGGSKGVPHKNIRLVRGKPLIAYSIAAARTSRRRPRVVVSTDDPQIARVAIACGAEVPFLRPAELAQDATPTLPVLQHCIAALGQQEGYRPDLIVLLQPTSPLRRAEHIDAALDLLLRTGADSVQSVCEAEHSPFWMHTLDESGRMSPLMADATLYSRRQVVPTVYRENGALYVTRPGIIINGHSILGEDTRAYIMAKEDSLDIDTEIDLMLAELLIERRGNEE